MPNTKSAAKAMRSSRRKQTVNKKTKEVVRKELKAIKALIAQGKKTDATAKLKEAYSALDKAVKKKVLKKNTASRSKSRLAKALGKI